MRITIAGFEGVGNSAKILLDQIKLDISKHYLMNDKAKSVVQLIDCIKLSDVVIVFGQKPVLKNKLCIELSATIDGDIVHTNYPIATIEMYCKDKYVLKRSSNAGTSYCNNVYYYGLKYIQEKQLSTKLIFIHIPMLKNISDFQEMVEVLQGYVEALERYFEGLIDT